MQLQAALQMFSYWTLQSALGSENSQLHFRDGETKLKEVKSLTSDHTGCKWKSQDLYSDQFVSKTSHCLILSGMPSQTERINSINLYDLYRVNIGNYVDGVYYSLPVTVPVKNHTSAKQWARH